MPASVDLHKEDVHPLLEPARAFTLLSALLVMFAGDAAADAEIVARVNGAPITRRQLDEVVQGTLALEKQAPDAAGSARLRRAALDSLIDFELLYQASIASGTIVADTEVNQEIDRNRGRFPDEASFRQALKRKGMTPEDLRAETRRMIAVNRYIERTVGRGLDVSAEAVGEFYQANRAEFHRPEQVRVSHILVRVDAGASDTLRREARDKAEDILTRIEDGADFADTARRHSEDRATAPNGGDLGFFARGTMVEAFETPVFSLLPGQVTGVFETQYGFHIAKVTDRRVEGTRPLDEVRDTIRDHLLERERTRRQTSLIEQLRRNATIDIDEAALAARS